MCDHSRDKEIPYADVEAAYERVHRVRHDEHRDHWDTEYAWRDAEGLEREREWQRQLLDTFFPPGQLTGTLDDGATYELHMSNAFPMLGVRDLHLWPSVDRARIHTAFVCAASLGGNIIYTRCSNCGTRVSGHWYTDLRELIHDVWRGLRDHAMSDGLAVQHEYTIE